MMKPIFNALFASLLLTTAATSIACADSVIVEQTCTTSYAVSKTAPTGKYVDRNGVTWVGFNADGTPPDSLSSAVNSTTCSSPAVVAPSEEDSNQEDEEDDDDMPPPM